jgi:hypothetical protein
MSESSNSLIKEFNLKEIVPNINFKIAHNDICLPSIQQILDPKYGITIDFDVYLAKYKKNLQRDFCWTLLQKQQFIYSLIKEISIPNLSVIDYSPSIEAKHSIIKVIDGKQRFSTLIKFCQNEFPIVNNGMNFVFDELPKKIQFRLWNYNFHAQQAYSYFPDALISDDDMIAWYRMVNFAGTPQDEEYLKNLTKPREFILPEIKENPLNKIVEERSNESIGNYINGTKSSY